MHVENITSHFQKFFHRINDRDGLANFLPCRIAHLADSHRKRNRHDLLDRGDLKAN